jgi:hypothetical protein
MPSLHAEILDVGGTRLADSKAVESQEHGEGGMRPVEALGRKEKCTELAPVHTPDLIGEDPRTTDVLSWIRTDTAIDVREAVETTNRREPTVNGRRRQSSFLERGPVEFDVTPRGGNDLETGVRSPLNLGPKIVSIGLERTT